MNNIATGLIVGGIMLILGCVLGFELAKHEMMQELVDQGYAEYVVSNKAEIGLLIKR